ncbi:MAG: hypothetical protein LBB63_00770 [Holosporaceae bacterium]|nr:hypothetical protein [Holosporaceae bacterium]
MKKAIKGLSLAMGIASMTSTADVVAMDGGNTITEPKSKTETPVVATMSREDINKEIEKWKCNVPNGLLGMKRDINVMLTTFFKANSDITEMCCVDGIWLIWIKHFRFKEQRIAPLDHIYNAVKNYNGTIRRKIFMMKNGLFYISIDLLFRRGTSRKSLFDLFLNSRNLDQDKKELPHKKFLIEMIFRYSLLRELMRLNGDPKALSASFFFNAMKNGYSLDQLKELEEQDGLTWLRSDFGLDITNIWQSSSSSSSSSSTAIGGLNLSSSSDSIGYQSLLDKFKSIDLFYDDAIATSSSSKSTPESSVCSSSEESSISFAEEQKGKLTPESIISLIEKKENSGVPTHVYLTQNNLYCLPLSMWFEPALIAGAFSEGQRELRISCKSMFNSTIDRLFLENDLNPKRVADILETTRDRRGRNLIKKIAGRPDINSHSATAILGELNLEYGILFSKKP